MRGKIDTKSGWLRVVKTRPVSYGWSNRYQTVLALMVKPLKTSLALMVSRIAFGLTMFSRLVVSGGGSPPTPRPLRAKSGRTYLLGAYVLAVENTEINRLRETVEKQALAERKLDESITRLVKECWRLSLPVHCEPTTTELERVVIGGDQ